MRPDADPIERSRAWLALAVLVLYLYVGLVMLGLAIWAASMSTNHAAGWISVATITFFFLSGGRIYRLLRMTLPLFRSGKE